MTALARVLALLLVLTPAFAQHSDFDRFDVTHYDLTVDFAPATKSFSGNVAVSYRVVVPMKSLLLFASHETIAVDSVLVEGSRADAIRRGDTLEIHLPRLLAPGERGTATVYYSGHSGFKGNYDGGGVYFPDSVAGKRFSTISEPSFARTWWPCKDLPSDKATVAVAATVPQGLMVASNGIFTSSSTQNSKTTFRWGTSYPIATYLVSIAAAPYCRIEDSYAMANGTVCPLVYYVYPADSLKAKEDFRNTGALLRFLSERFGEYPFGREKFGYAEVDGDLTMEHQTICSISAAIIDGKRTNELTYLHEMSHHWFGDLITPKTWYDCWLNEGFATYMEALYSEHLHGPASATEFAARLNATPQGSFAQPIVGKSDTAFWDAFNGSVYFKGAMVLHMLRGIVGDSTFFSALRAYCTNPELRYANATTADFVRECEHAAGTSLSWFFNEWLHAMPDTVDRPAYIYGWKEERRAGGVAVSLRVNQHQSPKALFTMPLTVRTYSRGTTADFRIVDSLATQTFTLPVATRPDSVKLDPDQWLLRSVREERWQ